MTLLHAKNVYPMQLLEKPELSTRKAGKAWQGVKLEAWTQPNLVHRLAVFKHLRELSTSLLESAHPGKTLPCRPAKFLPTPARLAVFLPRGIFSG